MMASRRLCVLSSILTWLSPRAWFIEKEILGLRELVEPGATCIDVGAEYGLYTYIFADLAGSSGQVHSIEPLPTPRKFISVILKLLGSQTVCVHDTALSSEVGSGTMSLPIRRHLPVHGRAFLTAGADGLGPNTEFSTQHSLTVKVATLDQLIKSRGIGRVDILKADVEGAEMAVLLGARSTLELDHPVLLLEIEDRHLLKYGVLSADVFEYLTRFGYTAYVWSQNHWRPVKNAVSNHRNYMFSVPRK